MELMATSPFGGVARGCVERRIMRVFSEDEFCAFVSCDQKTAQRWRMYGDGPKFVKAGRTILYRYEDVDDWLVENSKKTTRD